MKQGDALSLIYQLILDYAIRRVQAKWEGLKLNVTHQLLVYADYVNIVSGITYIIKKKNKTFISR